MAERLFHSAVDNQSSPSWYAENITPNDDADLRYVSREIRVTTAGNLAYVPYADKTQTVTITLLAGEKIALSAHRIKATNTTVTGILVLY